MDWRPMSDQDTLKSLIVATAAAATDPAMWQPCIEEVSAILGGAAVMLTLRPPRHGDPGCVVAAAIAPDFIRTYVETHYAHDPWVERMATHGPGIRFGYELVPRWHLLRSQFYRAWMVPQALLPELSIVLILKHGTRPLSTLAVHRRSDTRMLRLEDVHLLRRLLPHVQRAVRRTQRLQRASTTET